MTPAIKTTLAAVLGLAVGGGALYAVAVYQPAWLGLAADTAKEQESVDGDGGKKKGEREVAYWVAPMDPSYKRDEPGQSPMGMDLEPVYADELAAEPGAVAIDPAVVNQLGVRTAEAERRDLSRTLRTVGRVTYDERNLSHIHTRVKGWVAELHVDAQGDRVEVDEPILEIYSPELVTAQEEYLIARRRAGKLGDSGVGVPMSDMVRQARERLLFYGVSPTEIERLEETGEMQRTVLLRAPHAGVVTELGVREGMRVTPEDNLYTVADLSTVWVQADVYAYQSEWVAAGDPVTLTLPFYPGREWTGKVDYVYPYMDPETRTVKARLVFDNPDGALKPEMFATAVIDSDPREDVVAVPSEAVIRTGKRTVVVTAQGRGKFRPVAVETGIESGEWVEIREGLEAGTEVVTSGQFLLDSEADFDAAMDRMESETGQQMDHGDGDMDMGEGESMEGMDHGDMDGEPKDDGSGSMEGHDMPDQSAVPTMPPVGAASAATAQGRPRVAAGIAAPAKAPVANVGAASGPGQAVAAHPNRGGDAAPTTALVAGVAK